MNHHNHRVSRIENPESSIQYRASSIKHPESSIENPTLAHFRHFRHFSSLFTNSPLYICRGSSTNQLLFMQNKPNFQKAKMNINSLITTDYENKWQRRVRKNKPNSNPIKSNFKPGDGFSAYYKRDCHVADFTLSAAEGGLAMIFLGAFLQVAAPA